MSEALVRMALLERYTFLDDEVGPSEGLIPGRSADGRDIDVVSRAFGGSLPPDYVEVLSGIDGFSGKVCHKSDGNAWTYIGFFPASEVVERNVGYTGLQHEPSMMLVGSDLSGIAVLLRRPQFVLNAQLWVELPFDDFGETNLSSRLERSYASLADLLDKWISECPN